MIKLLELSFVGIGRFASVQTIDFRNRGKLIQIDGQNNNTGGSSGSGKSTVFNALNYLLGLSDIPTTVLQSRITKTSIAVDGLFDIDGVLVKISRSKKDGLVLVIGEETVSGNIKLAEERLEQLIGIPVKLFKKMIHKKQKEGGFFLQLTAKESFDFLIKVLGLESWTQKIEKIDKDIVAITEKSKDLAQQGQSIDLLLAGYENTHSSVIAPVLTVNISQIPVITAQIEQSKKSIEALDFELNNKLSEIPVVVKDSAVFDTVELTKLEAQLIAARTKKTEVENSQKETKRLLNVELDVIKNKVRTFVFTKTELDRVVANIQSLKAQKTHLETASCPTCSQTWVGDSAKNKLDSLTVEILALANTAYSLKLELDTEPETIVNKTLLEDKIKNTDNSYCTKEFVQEIEDCLELIAHEKSKQRIHETSINTKYHAEQTTYQLAVATCKNLFTENLTVAKNTLTAQETELREINTAVNSFNAQHANYLKSLETLTNSIQESKLKKDTLMANMSEICQSIVVAQESKRLIKNYTLQIFQESLDCIGEEATQIMSKIPNMSSASIYFEGCKEAKNGNIKDEINPMISVDGEPEVPFKSLSGGESTSVELAVDLAVINMIEFKTGKGANWLILDEPFTGLDSTNCDSVMNMLVALDTSKHIIIVDHNDSVKAMVNETIIVERNNEESSVLS